MNRLVVHTALLALLGVISCGESTPPDSERAEAELRFLRFTTAAPPLVTTRVQFWAKRGQDREVSIFHRPRAGESDSTRFLYFKVPGSSLERRPGGTLFAEGDSVLITITVVDPVRAIVRFEPAGLGFSSRSPARLKFEFEEADDDLDGDGDDDAADSALEAQLRVWRQETAGRPWIKLGSFSASLHEIEADLMSFTNYAVAY